MNYFKRVSRARIAFVAGLLAIFLAFGPALASDKGSKGNKGSKASEKDSKGSKGKKGKKDDKSSKGSKGTKGSKGKKGDCTVDADCKDGYICREDGKCKKDKDCETDADCKDGYVCREDGKCKKDKDCETDADCKDGYVCREDGKCKKDDDKPCEIDADCKAGERCGDDGECHEEDDGCDDTDACTIDTVTDDVCSYLPIAGCVACDRVEQCNDSNTCTTDLCTERGICEHRTVEGCEPATPQTAEICGDCADNDGNGMADFEDPACCSGTIYTMTLSKARFLSKRGASQLSLNSTLARPVLAGVNALSHDLYVQIRPVKGSDILCARIPGDNFKHAGRTLKFTAGKRSVASAHGIKKVLLKVRHHGGARVKIVGKKMPMSHLQQGAMQITLGFYNPQMGDEQSRCTSTMASFRAKKNSALVAP